MSLLTKTQIVENLREFEDIRYQVEKDGVVLGFVSLFNANYFDGSHSWAVWKNPYGGHISVQSLDGGMRWWEDQVRPTVAARKEYEFNWERINQHKNP